MSILVLQHTFSIELLNRYLLLTVLLFGILALMASYLAAILMGSKATLLFENNGILDGWKHRL